MNRNSEEVQLFGETYTLYERSAQDVLSLSEFAIKQNAHTLGTVIYQSAFVLEASLKPNKKEMPELYKDNVFKRFLRKFIANKKYDAYEKELLYRLEYNSKIKSEYLLANLSQKEMFDLAKKVYLLEGIDLDAQSKTEEPTEKKS
jgi:hypothetical protein